MKSLMKLKLTWQTKMFTLLMQQPVTEDNMHDASCAVGAWLGEKTSTMSQDEIQRTAGASSSGP